MFTRLVFGKPLELGFMGCGVFAILFGAALPFVMYHGIHLDFVRTGRLDEMAGMTFLGGIIVGVCFVVIGIGFIVEAISDWLENFAHPYRNAFTWIRSELRRPKQKRLAWWQWLLIHFAIWIVYLPILFAAVGLTPKYQWGGPIAAGISTLAAYLAMLAADRWVRGAHSAKTDPP